MAVFMSVLTQTYNREGGGINHRVSKNCITPFGSFVGECALLINLAFFLINLNNCHKPNSTQSWI